MIKEERGRGIMRPIIVKIGLALALSFAGFLRSRLKISRTNPSPKSSTGSTSGEVNLEGDIGAALSTCTTVSEEETCIDRSKSEYSPNALSPSNKQNGAKNEFLLPEFNELVKEVEFEATTVGNSLKDIEAQKLKVGSCIGYTGSGNKNDYEQEIIQLRNIIRMLQDKEQNLEVQLLEYCGLREQETAVRELQNRLKISNMEVKMFNLKVKNLLSENWRLKEQITNHAKVLAELETAKAKIEQLNKKIRNEEDRNREQIITLQQRVAKLRDQECKDAACDHDIRIKLQKLKALESEEEELRKSNLRLQIENSDLSRRLASTQILANAVMEDREANAVKQESERLREENEGLMKQIEQLQSDRCSDIEELVYMRWINACLRYELRNYQPPPGKTVAKDLSKCLSPTSEKKAKQLILEYAHNEPGSIVDFDLDQWSSSQASSITDCGECDDFSSVDNSSSSRTNTTRQTKFFSKLRRLILGKDSNHHHSSVSSEYREDSYSPQPSTSTRIEGRASFDFSRSTSMKEGDRRYSGSNSIIMGSSNKYSLSKEGSFLDSLDIEKSDLEKYAEALKDSRVNANHQRRGRSASYS